MERKTDNYTRYLTAYTQTYNRTAEVYGYKPITEAEAAEHKIIRMMREGEDNETKANTI